MTVFKANVWTVNGKDSIFAIFMFSINKFTLKATPGEVHGKHFTFPPSSIRSNTVPVAIDQTFPTYSHR